MAPSRATLGLDPNGGDSCDSDSQVLGLLPSKKHKPNPMKNVLANSLDDSNRDNTTPDPASAGSPAEESEEDDYMSMTIPTTVLTSTKESSLQRRARLKKEAEIRSRPKSKAELAAEESARREAALSTSLFTGTDGETSNKSSSKGMRMMSKLGYLPGQTLGKEGGLAEPLMPEFRDRRSGIGADEEKKRKLRETAERSQGEVKRRKEEAVDYRDRVARESEEKRNESLWWGAMKVAEELDQESAGAMLRSVPLVYRSLVRQRVEKKRDDRMRNALNTGLGVSRERTLERSDYDDSEEADSSGGEDEGTGNDGKNKSNGKEHEDGRMFAQEEVELESEDAELDAFEALPAAERLEKLVGWLRERFWYCFWCKSRFESEGMEGCPGLKEEDHD